MRFDVRGGPGGGGCAVRCEMSESGSSSRDAFGYKVSPFRGMINQKSKFYPVKEAASQPASQPADRSHCNDLLYRTIYPFQHAQRTQTDQTASHTHACNNR